MDGDKILDASNNVGNLLWVLLGGLIMALAYWLTAIAYCCTIIGIHVGIQLFKLGKFVLCPFGYTMEKNGDLLLGCLGTLLNIFWIFFGGIELALMHLAFALVLCITIIGIPFGMQHFKLAWYVLVPFGKSVVKN